MLATPVVMLQVAGGAGRAATAAGTVAGRLPAVCVIPQLRGGVQLGVPQCDGVRPVAAGRVAEGDPPQSALQARNAAHQRRRVQQVQLQGAYCNRAQLELAMGIVLNYNYYMDRSQKLIIKCTGIHVSISYKSNIYKNKKQK